MVQMPRMKGFSRAQVFALVRDGAHAQKNKLLEQVRRIDALFPSQQQHPAPATVTPTPAKTEAAPRRGRRVWSKAARQAQSKRLKKSWAKRRRES